MRKYRFYKNELGWFIDLKWFPFGKHWLAMIAGADTLLDNLSENKNEVFLEVSTAPIPFYDGILKRTQTVGLLKGAFYTETKGYTPTKRRLVSSIWLCPVIVWVFWNYPKRIYFKIAK